MTPAARAPCFHTASTRNAARHTELRACWCRPQAPCRKVPSIHWWGRQELKEKFPTPKPF